jgi:M6 family metalloprotease-like protein
MQERGSSGTASIRSQAAQVVAQRSTAFAALIQEDPRAALSFAFSPELLADLVRKFPGSASQLESHATVTGPVERWTADYPGLKSSRSWLTMRLAGTSLTLHFAYQEPPNLKGGDVVQVTGVVVGSLMAVETSGIARSTAASTSTSAPTFNATLAVTNVVREQRGPMFFLLLFVVALTTLRRWITSHTFREQLRCCAVSAVSLTLFVLNPSITSAQTSTCSTTGVQNTAVILVTFPGITLPTGVNTQSLNDSFFGTTTGVSLDGFLRDASDGQTSATGSVFGPYTLTGAYTTCTDVGGALLNDAIAAAVAGGANLNNYSRVFLVFPDTLNCGWAGFASNSCTITSSSGNYNASLAYLAARYVANRADTVSLASHEIGHNLGLLHSGIITAGSDVLGPISSPGTMYDQNGDYWSTMGELVLGTYPSPQKSEVLGWMAPNSNYQSVQNSGTYTLQPLETSPAALQALKIQRGTGNNAWLWVEYRQPIDNYDSTLSPQPFSGALIHYEDISTQTGHTYLPNFTPTDTTWNSPALAVGKTWNDPYSNVSISVLSATSAGLTVSVNYGATPCISSAPTVMVSPLNPSIYPGQSASYSGSVTNNDSSVCSSSTINLGSSEPSGWSTSLSSSSVMLSPGQSASVTFGKGAPSGTPAGTYAVNLNASNNAGTGTGTANATVVTPPSLAVAVSVSGASFTRPGTVPLTGSVTTAGTPASGASVTFTLTAPNSSTTSQTTTTGSNGTATWNYKLSSRSLAGTYSVVAQAALSSGSKKSASTQTVISGAVTFTVQ